LAPDSNGEARAALAVSEQFAVRLLTTTYQMRTRLETVEADEQDPARLEALYSLDHAVSRTRRQAENLLVITGRPIEEGVGQQVTTLLDVVRAAISAIDHYEQVHIGRMADLAVADFASDDVIRVMTELLDNATRFSPPTAIVHVAAHLTERGSVLLRVQDEGVGLNPDHVAWLNALLASDEPSAIDPGAVSRIGLVVVQRLALAQGLRVQLTGRPSAGVTASVLVPDRLLCEIPPDDVGQFDRRPPGRGRPAPPQHRPATFRHRETQTETHGARRAVRAHPEPLPPAPLDVPRQGAAPHGLPLRVRASLRDEQPAAFRRPAPDGQGLAHRPWADDTADFAAGINDARPSAHPTSEGSPQ
jgi:hypothetical protein